MAAASLDLRTLTAFDNVAAGHDGVLTDPSGALVIKPCTQAEINFYEESLGNHEDFALLMPTYMGTLQLGKSKQLEDTIASAHKDSAIVLPNAIEATGQEAHERLPARGKPLDTELAVVLENVASGFKRPNILDVKLGKRLWADDAPPAKKQKFDKVAGETTSGSLGFRVAGMKIWNVDSYKPFDKWYGRTLTPETVHCAFEELFCVSTADDSLFEIIDSIVAAVEEIEDIVAGQESRMYSASLLLVYEGDSTARKEAIEAAAGQSLAEGVEGGMGMDDDDDDEDAEQQPAKKIFDIRIIDFAHAKWTPGEGPDENMLIGIRSVRDVMRRLAKAIKQGNYGQTIS